jgi:hypothetical protein
MYINKYIYVYIYVYNVGALPVPVSDFNGQTSLDSLSLHSESTESDIGYQHPICIDVGCNTEVEYPTFNPEIQISELRIIEKKDKKSNENDKLKKIRDSRRVSLIGE